MAGNNAPQLDLVFSTALTTPGLATDTVAVSLWFNGNWCCTSSNDTVTGETITSAAPEPATFLFGGTGLFGLAGLQRIRRIRAAKSNQTL